ncbi:hypothetical protein JCM10213v2_002399 [Rhodosporidiobolus nylandii]
MGAGQSSQKADDPPRFEELSEQAAPSAASHHSSTDAGVQGETNDATAASTPTPTASAPAPEPAQAAQPSSSSSTQPADDVFKVPALPAASATSPSTTLRALPADMAHILSLNAHEPDEALSLAAQTGGESELQRTVREMKEKALLNEDAMEDEEVKKKKKELEELKRIEEELRRKGVTREAQQLAQEDEQMEEGKVDEKDIRMDADDSSSDSDSDGSSDLDLTPANTGRNRNRRGRGGAGGGDSDIDDDEDGVGGTGGAAPKTEHELAEPEIALPQLQKLDEAQEIVRFGRVESVIENVVVLKADTAGDWRVLDEGTIVCWEDKVVIGAIFETFGSVQQPFYSLRFPASAPPDPAVFALQRPVFYSPGLAQFVFTRDLRHLKGSDASNIWDEEVGANEVEFSDDEEEAEYKKRQKAERRARTQSATPAASSRAPSAAPTSRPQATSSSYLPPAHLPARPAVSYADEATPYSSTTLPPSGPMASSSTGPRAEMGVAPPPGRVGRRMFERDTGMKLEEGEEVEFEFSSGDEGGPGGMSDGDDARSEAGKAARGAVEAAPPTEVQREADVGGDAAAAPSFQSDLPTGPEGGIDQPVRMSAPAPAPPSAGPAFTFGRDGPPPTGPAAAGNFEFGGGRPSPQQQQKSPPFAHQQQQPMPWSSSASSSASSSVPAPPPPQHPYPQQSPSYGAPYPHPAQGYYGRPPPPQQAYYPGPSSYGAYPPAGAGGGGYSPHDPSAAAPPPGAAQYNPIVAPGGGHVNPRFLEQQRQQQQQQQGQGQPGQQGYYGAPGYGAPPPQGYGGWGR